MTDEYYIALICNGGFDVIPDISIGELFEAYFDNINYNVIKEGNKTFVDFTGITLYDNKEESILIRFLINPNNEEFAIVEVRVGNEFLEEDDVVELLEDIEFVGKTILEDENSNYEEFDNQNYNDIDTYDDIDNYDDEENYVFFDPEFGEEIEDENTDYYYNIENEDNNHKDNNNNDNNNDNNKKNDNDNEDNNK